MALYDVDKNQDSRGNPTPNASDAHTQRRSDGTTSITNKVGTPDGAYTKTNNATILVFDGTVNRVLIGLSPSGTYGIWVSKEGIDVLTAFN